MSQFQGKHFQVTLDEHQIAWVRFDQANTSVNVLNGDNLKELEAILDQAEKDSNWRGLVLYSGKEKGFIAGADIEQFTRMSSSEQAKELLERVHGIYHQLEALSIPTVAMISGFCLGGGCELAMACRYRVAEEDDKTRLGLPEVKLGIKPGWGGSVRLPRLVGVFSAMDLMLTGRLVSAKQAAKIGLVDVAVPKRQLESAVRYFIENEPDSRKAPWWSVFTELPFIRKQIGKKLFTRAAQKVNPDHYPAPTAIIEDWVKVGSRDEAAGFEQEISTVSHLVMTPGSQQLVRVFYLQEQLKKMTTDTSAPIRHVHVMGAGGVMGGDIAAWCALQGCIVTLQDQHPENLQKTLQRAHQLYEQKLKKPSEIQKVWDRLIPDQGGGLAKADLIIEAIFEEMSLKQKVLKEIESKALPTAIIATNTSSLPLDEISQLMKKPERLVGIHFFNPVSQMQLVEIVIPKRSLPEVINRAINFVKQIGRLPLLVKSHPGFLVNRVLMPYLMEAVRLLEEGVSPTLIDEVAVEFGMPMGPIELADTVGLDICLSVAKVLTQVYGGEISPLLSEKVEKHELGKKTGEGFYHYQKGKKQSYRGKATETPSEETIQNRLIGALLNEAAACWEDKIVETLDYLDAGMIFGTGFAPFRGGPIQYIRAQGVEKFYDQLKLLSETLGARFTPSPGWQLLRIQLKSAR